MVIKYKLTYLTIMLKWAELRMFHNVYTICFKATSNKTKSRNKQFYFNSINNSHLSFRRLVFEQNTNK